MKKIFILLFLLVFPPFIAAAPATPSATGVSKDVQNKIDDLKERLATKVAELRKTTPRAIYGTVTQVSVSSITVDATEKAYKIELTDSIKVSQIIKGKRTELTTENVEKNDVVTVFGEYDQTLDILQAKYIFIESAKMPVRLHGIIGEINKKDNSFTLTGVDNATYTIDVDAATKNNVWTSADGIQKGGFSKLEKGMFVTIVGMENSKTADRFSAMRILSLKISSSATTTITPSPAEKSASPSATPKTKETPVPTKSKTTPAATSTAKPTVKPTIKPTTKPTPAS